MKFDLDRHVLWYKNIGDTLWYLKLKLMGGAVSILPRADVDIYWLEFSEYIGSSNKAHNG